MHLQELGLAHCKLGSCIADKIGIMLSHNSSILSVDLSHNGIDNSGVERLVYHLKDNNTPRSVSRFESCNKITILCALHLREVVNTLDCIKLSPNTSLGHVGLNSSHFRSINSFHATYCYIKHRVKSINFIVPNNYEDSKFILKI